MSYLYILQSEKAQRYYIGTTDNLDDRVVRHNRGNVLSTKAYTPWTLVFHKQYDTLSAARTAEYKFKRFKNRKIIDRIVQEQTVHI